MSPGELIRRPLVAVSQRVDSIAGRHETRDALDQRLERWLLAAGMLPVAVPNGLDDPAALSAWLAAVAPQAIVLSGGNDVGERPERDATEAALVAHAAAVSLPLLGICRGMQMLAHLAGTVLVQVSGHAGTRHPLLPAAGVTGLPSEVNSFHNWALADCPEGFDILARAADGSLEAMRHRSRRWEGWMWHPERESDFAVTDLERLRQLFFPEKFP